MRTVNTINTDWYYAPEFREEYTSLTAAPDWQRIRIPHTNRELPLNSFDERQSFFVSTYFRKVRLTAGSRTFLDFDGVMCACDVWVNGQMAGSHEGGYTPFSVELTDFSKAGEDANVVVRVDSTEREDIPPFGHVVDYLCFGGIYRDVRLRTQDHAYIASVFARPEKPLEAKKDLAIELTVDGLLNDAAGAVKCELLDGTRVVGSAQVDLVPNRNSYVARIDAMEGLRVWDIDDPALYGLRVTLAVSGSDGDGPTDEWTTRIGFRAAEFRKDGFFLNGRRVKLVGLNRHQAWPYVGYAMPARAQRRDAEILKRELGVNLVRTSHYPQSPYFLDACDELGLLVFEEMPGWQFIGGPEWQDTECVNLEEMIRRDRNRPSIVLWGVRVNESPDSHDFYVRTNALARRLDPTRQTGGVRCIGKSELLEDVYTFNEFNYSGEAEGKTPVRKQRIVTGKRTNVPYLVTEHNGHMFPTKRFDNEERLAEHALRHARVLDAAFADQSVSGAIGWCAFDYNTHKDFGSGDRICYHGVMDIFREPKFAAAVYASQGPCEKGVVLEAASRFAKGERCAVRMIPVQVWTNCDSVVLWRGGERIGEFFPDRGAFPNLPHPPIIIHDFIGDRIVKEGFSERDNARIRKAASVAFEGSPDDIGLVDKIHLASFLVRKRMAYGKLYDMIADYVNAWGSKDEAFRLEGFFNGKKVAERVYGGDACAVALEVRADDDALSVGDWDTTRLTVRAVDRFGNTQPYAAEALDVRVEGAGELIGPNLMPLSGGSTAFWVRTAEAAKPGDSIRVIVRSGRLGESVVTIEIR